MATAHHRPARRAPAFRDVDTVTVRCPRCRKRLAEVWTIEDVRGHGWDGMIYAERLVPYLLPDVEGVTYLDASISPGDHAHKPVNSPRSLIDPDKWRCPRCTATYTINDADLHAAITTATGTPPQVTLGEAPSRQHLGVSRDW